ncbi:MAG: class I SAM-dependent methyltransferase [Vicinamibacterales bacterium]
MTTTTTMDQTRATQVARLRIEHTRLYGTTSDAWFEYVSRRNWDEAMPRFRLLELIRYGARAGQARILEVGAGCGTFVSHALSEGYDCWGFEPDLWKIELFRERIRTLHHPDPWTDRLVSGAAEALPYPDGTFDYVTSAQFLEHVHDPEQALREMVRVTRVGGGIGLRCPDYRSTFEPHYQLPWIPLFPRPLANAYLRMLARPVLGLAMLRYVTRPRILGWLRQIERDGRCRLVVTDDNRVTFENALRRRRLPGESWGFPIWRTAQYLAALGRRETGINLFIRVAQ